MSAHFVNEHSGDLDRTPAEAKVSEEEKAAVVSKTFVKLHH